MILFEKLKKLRKLASLVTVVNLFVNKVYIGGGLDNWKPENKEYVNFIYKKDSVINLDFTILNIRRMVSFVGNLLIRKKIKILIVSNIFSLKSFGERLDIILQKLNNPFIYQWIPGLLTNFRPILRHLKKKKINKNINLFDLGIKLPRIVFFLSTCNSNVVGVRECLYLKIPSIGLSDTNSFFGSVNYPIISNDDSFLSIYFFLSLFINVFRVSNLTKILDNDLIEFNNINVNAVRSEIFQIAQSTANNIVDWFSLYLVWFLKLRYRFRLFKKYIYQTKRLFRCCYTLNLFGSRKNFHVLLSKSLNYFKGQNQSIFVGLNNFNFFKYSFQKVSAYYRYRKPYSIKPYFLLKTNKNV